MYYPTQNCPWSATLKYKRWRTTVHNFRRSILIASWAQLNPFEDMGPQIVIIDYGGIQLAMDENANDQRAVHSGGGNA